MFKGSHTALITPFDGKSIDEKSFRSLIDFQISEGIHGLEIGRASCRERVCGSV